MTEALKDAQVLPYFLSDFPSILTLLLFFNVGCLEIQFRRFLLQLVKERNIYKFYVFRESVDLLRVGVRQPRRARRARQRRWSLTGSSGI
jgi:hypothetical protein